MKDLFDEIRDMNAGLYDYGIFDDIQAPEELLTIEEMEEGEG